MRELYDSRERRAALPKSSPVLTAVLVSLLATVVARRLQRREPKWFSS
jgi:hypothetical protein